MTDLRNDDPAAIEAEIRQTQDNMSRTVEKIGSQLTPKNLFNALLDKADDNNVDARMLLDGARRNPVALGMIAIGAIWLISEKDAKLPSLPKRNRDTRTDAFSGASDPYGETSSHDDYLSHMSAVEQQADENAESYQRRHDTARSKFFKVERGNQEDDAGFRRRLDGMAERIRGSARTLSARSGQSSAAVGEKARQASQAAKAGYANNPLLGGIIAAAVGAAVGASLPLTRQEEEKLAGVGGKARSLIGEHTDQVASQLREKKDGLLEQADAALGKQPETANDDYVRLDDPATTQFSTTQA